MGPRHHSHRCAAGWPHPAPTPLTRGVKPAAGAVRALLPLAGGGSAWSKPFPAPKFSSSSFMASGAPPAEEIPPVEVRWQEAWRCGSGGVLPAALPFRAAFVPQGCACPGGAALPGEDGLEAVCCEDGGQHRGGACVLPRDSQREGKGSGGSGAAVGAAGHGFPGWGVSYPVSVSVAG